MDLIVWPLIVAALLFTVVAPALRIAAIRAERAGDAERAQGLRLTALRLRVGLVALLTLGMFATVVLAVT